jgi:hypothetical protein
MRRILYCFIFIVFFASCQQDMMNIAKRKLARQKSDILINKITQGSADNDFINAKFQKWAKQDASLKAHATAKRGFGLLEQYLLV